MNRRIEAIALAAALAASQSVVAQQYSSKPVHLATELTAGSGADNRLRRFAADLGSKRGKIRWK